MLQANERDGLSRKETYPPVMQVEAVQNEAVHFAGLYPVAVNGLFRFCAGWGNRDEQVERVEGSLIAQAGKEFREERISRSGVFRRQDIANGVSFLSAQLTGSPVGDIAHFLGSPDHLLRGFFGNIGVAIHGARDSGYGEVKLFGDVANGDRHDFPLEITETFQYYYT